MATQLKDLLSGWRHVPSDSLASTFRCCERNPSENISTRLRAMLNIFYKHYTETDDESSSLAREYSNQTEALYYRVLEAVIDQEKSILDCKKEKRLNAIHLSGILENDLFQRSLVACCLEIVLFSHQPSSRFCFPRVIDIYSLSPYNFHKVIEPVLRAVEFLLPAVVRHLTRIEEQVLESLAWSVNSPLWDHIKEAKDQGQVPTCHQVMPPQNLQYTGRESQNPPNPSALIPGHVNHPHGNNLNSQMILHDRYSSPHVGSNMASGQTIPVGQLQSCDLVTRKTMVAMASPTVSTNNGQSVTIPVQVGLQSTNQPDVSSNTTQQPPTSGTNKPERGGSLSLFFRKVYHLASMHLTIICDKLHICEDLRLKIWTCFEYSLVHCTDLMLDQHLDQILMCAIYAVSKATNKDISFKDIVTCYETQIHASNSVCRDALIRNTSTSQNLPGSSRENIITQTLQLDPFQARSLGRAGQEERGQLFQFYNNVYVTKMNDFAMGFSSSSLTTDGVETPPLSTYPKPCIGALRRLRPSNQHSLYISSYKPDTPPSTPHATGFLYHISKTPSKSLREINNMIRTSVVPSRKHCVALLQDSSEEEEECEPPVKRHCQESASASF
ncbi:hypothetical protein UPYG_G00087030 [Umbra pygmaea]|uniref:Retinoblastoma-associated protein A-box domain-containing protein n=1 Tax=Umbra pygmaea TaxID=75934 RepID=A0ABD0XI97_UMBPY